MIPSVEVLDENSGIAEKPSEANVPEKINAIDNPELFHVSKDDYQPKTEKKNGRFVVPDLLSKGTKKKRKRSRRRSRRTSEEKKLVEQSLAKLKENTSSPTLATQDTSQEQSHQEKSRSSRRSRRSGSSRSRSSSRKEEKATNPKVVGGESLGKLSRTITWTLDRLVSALKEPNGKLEYLLVGVGALAAIPILHLLMWWFVGIDPFGMARPTNRVVPFLVPNAMKPAVEEESKAPLLIRPKNNAPIKSSESAVPPKTGKLPRPNLDPSSVHAE